jgi:hypothetical protein
VVLLQVGYEVCISWVLLTHADGGQYKTHIAKDTLEYAKGGH